MTGAAGFIGAQVTRLLHEAGEEVIALVRPGGSRARLAGLGDVDCVELALDDGEGLDRLLRERRPDAALHLAWYTSPADYLVSQKNVSCLGLSASLASRILASGCPKLVGVGTCLEYAPSDRPLSESDPVDPRSLYASAKHAAWLLARALAAAHGAELAWARVFHLFGPGEHPARLVPQVTAALRGGEPIEVTAGEQVRDYLHVRDVAAGIVALVRPGVSGVVNVCSGEPRPLAELLRALGRLLGRPELLRFGARPYARDEAMYLAGRADRLRSLGWHPRFPDFEGGLRDTLEAES